MLGEGVRTFWNLMALSVLLVRGTPESSVLAGHAMPRSCTSSNLGLGLGLGFCAPSRKTCGKQKPGFTLGWG